MALNANKRNVARWLLDGDTDMLCTRSAYILNRVGLVSASHHR
jgi:hypothetical protein